MRSPAQILEEYTVLQVQDGVPQAFVRLVKLRGPKLFGHAIRLLGHREDARDAVQDAWVEILRGLAGLREPRAFASWSTRIVTRRCARNISQKIKRRELGAMVWSEAQIPPETDNPFDEQSAVVRAAIAKLSPVQSATVALYYLEEMSVAEVAIALDIPCGTVKTRLMHARENLQSELKGLCHDKVR